MSGSLMNPIRTHRGSAWVLAFAALAGCGSDMGQPGRPDADGSGPDGPIPDAAPEVDAFSQDGVSPSMECVEHASNPYTVTLRGSNLGAYESQTVHVATSVRLVSTPSVSCTASGGSQITGGQFEVTVQNRTDSAVYPTVGMFIDVDGDGVCDAATDAVWGLTFSLVRPDMTFSIDSSDLGQTDGVDVCALFGN
jgi:hypothetical protein